MPTGSLHLVGLDEVRRNWGWFFALGIVLVVLGTIAIGRACLLTVASMMFFGWLMIIGGTIEACHAFWKQRGWSGFFIDLLTGVLYFVVGFMMVANPGQTAAVFTLLIAMFLIFGGIFRIVTAVAIHYPNWSWVLFHGVVSLLLGNLIWRQWPISGLWVIGLFVGIDMIFNGWSLVMLGLAVKNLCTDVADAPSAPEGAA